MGKLIFVILVTFKEYMLFVKLRFVISLTFKFQFIYSIH
jgi:hypothetical protein